MLPIVVTAIVFRRKLQGDVVIHIIVPSRLHFGIELKLLARCLDLFGTRGFLGGLRTSRSGSLVIGHFASPFSGNGYFEKKL
jgi:hypothetical protein